MKCIADFYIKDCIMPDRCCDDCDYENCEDSCREYDERESGCVGCSYAVGTEDLGG